MAISFDTLPAEIQYQIISLAIQFYRDTTCYPEDANEKKSRNYQYCSPLIIKCDTDTASALNMTSPIYAEHVSRALGQLRRMMCAQLALLNNLEIPQYPDDSECKYKLEETRLLATGMHKRIARTKSRPSNWPLTNPLRCDHCKFMRYCHKREDERDIVISLLRKVVATSTLFS